jgi:hypothetical protein
VEAWKVARAELAIFLNFPRFGTKGNRLNEPTLLTCYLAAGHRQETKNGELGHQRYDVQKLLVCPDGLIPATVGRQYFAKVVLCSLDTFSWSLSTHDRWRWYEDVAFSNGKVYALTGEEDLLAFDVGIDANTSNAVVSLVKRVIQSRLPREATAKVRYLVRSAAARCSWSAGTSCPARQRCGSPCSG